MTTCRPTPRMAGNTSRSTRMAGSIMPFGPPFNIGIPPDQRLADPPRRSQDRQRRDLGARRPQQRRRRRRSAHRPILVHRKRPRLDQRRHAERQAQHDLEDRRAFRLSLLPPGRYAGSEIRDGSQVLGIHPAGRQSRRARGAARHEVLYRRSIPRRVQEQHPDRRARLLEPAQVPGRPHQARDRRCRRQERQAGDLCLRLARGRLRAISAVRTTSSSPRTVRSWWPTTGPARSIASANKK